MMGKSPAITDDIYSLGVTLYELLTTKPPFYRGNIEWQVLNECPPSIGERKNELGVSSVVIPDTWSRAILSCLEKDKDLRPQTVRDFIGLIEIDDSVRVKSLNREINSSFGNTSGQKISPSTHRQSKPACVQCGHVNANSAKHCLKCGFKNIHNECPKCHSVYPENGNYCGSCGLSIAEYEEIKKDFEDLKHILAAGMVFKSFQLLTVLKERSSKF